MLPPPAHYLDPLGGGAPSPPSTLLTDTVRRWRRARPQRLWDREEGEEGEAGGCLPAMPVHRVTVPFACPQSFSVTTSTQLAAQAGSAPSCAPAPPPSPRRPTCLQCGW